MGLEKWRPCDYNMTEGLGVAQVLGLRLAVCTHLQATGSQAKSPPIGRFGNPHDLARSKAGSEAAAR